MAAGISAGRIGWGLAIRLVRVLAGMRPFSPIALIENPNKGIYDWLRALYRLTCPIPLNWGHVVAGRLLLGRFWLLRFLIKEAVWAKLPNSIYYAARLCKEDLSYGLVEPSAAGQHIMMPLAFLACAHFAPGLVVNARQRTCTCDNHHFAQSALQLPGCFGSRDWAKTGGKTHGRA